MASSVEERAKFMEDGIKISLAVPKRDVSASDFSGMCQGAGGGCAVMSPTVSGLDQAPKDLDLDAMTGYKRRPGTAGAHPVMRYASTAEAYAFMQKQAGSLVPKNESAKPAYVAPVFVQETD